MLKSRATCSVFILIAAVLLTGVERAHAQRLHPAEGGGVDCAIDAGPCRRMLEGDGIQVAFAIYPVPVAAMKELLFIVTITEEGAPVTDAAAGLDLTMPGMFMGVNRPELIHAGEGRYEGRGILPRCPHGGKVWQAEVSIARAGQRASVRYVFEVKP